MNAVVGFRSSRAANHCSNSLWARQVGIAPALTQPLKKKPGLTDRA